MHPAQGGPPGPVDTSVAPPTLMSAVVALAGVRRGQVVVDVSSGTGRWARPAAAAAGRAGRVLSFTASAGEHREAAAAPADPAWAPIVRALALPTALPLRAGSADIGLWVTSPSSYAGTTLVGALGELRRVTRPGSRVVVSFPFPADAVPVAMVTGAGFTVEHVTEDRWAGRPLTLAALRRR